MRACCVSGSCCVYHARPFLKSASMIFRPSFWSGCPSNLADVVVQRPQESVRGPVDRGDARGGAVAEELIGAPGAEPLRERRAIFTSGSSMEVINTSGDVPEILRGQRRSC